MKWCSNAVKRHDFVFGAFYVTTSGPRGRARRLHGTCRCMSLRQCMLAALWTVNSLSKSLRMKSLKGKEEKKTRERQTQKKEHFKRNANGRETEGGTRQVSEKTREKTGERCHVLHTWALRKGGRVGGGWGWGGGGGKRGMMGENQFHYTLITTYSSGRHLCTDPVLANSALSQCVCVCVC